MKPAPFLSPTPGPRAFLLSALAVASIVLPLPSCKPSAPKTPPAEPPPVTSPAQPTASASGPAPAVAPTVNHAQAEEPSWEAFERAGRILASTDTIDVSTKEGEASLRAKVQEALLYLARAIELNPKNTIARERFAWEVVIDRDFLRHLTNEDGSVKHPGYVPLGEGRVAAAIRNDPESFCVISFTKETSGGTEATMARVFNPARNALLATLNFSPHPAPSSANPPPASPAANPLPAKDSPGDLPPAAAPAPAAAASPAIADTASMVVHEGAQRVVSVIPEGPATLWSFSSHEPLRQLPGEGFVSASFRADGRQFLTTTKAGVAQIWDSASGQPGPALNAGSPLAYAAFSHEGTQIATAAEDGTIQLWEATTGRRLSKIAADPHLSYLAYSPDGSQLLSLLLDPNSPERQTAALWRVPTGERAFAVRDRLILDLLFTPTGPLAAAIAPSPAVGKTASIKDRLERNTVSIWNLGAGKIVMTLPHPKEVTAAWFSPDGRRLATVASDHAARVWDVPSGRLLAELWPDFEPEQAAFSADGMRVVAFGHEAGKDLEWHAVVWDASLPQACAASAAPVTSYQTLAAALTGQRLPAKGGSEAPEPLAAGEDKATRAALEQLAAAASPEGQLAQWVLGRGALPTAEGKPRR